MKFLQKFFGNPHTKPLKKLWPIVNSINALEDHFAELTDDALQQKTQEFKEKIQAENDNRKMIDILNEILPEAFAVVREASKRTLKMRHYDVQILGGIALHQGNIAEMKTGEGKTLAATLPAYLNALSGKSVHIVTVNDYLARRDAEEMGVLFEFLGLKTAAIIHGQTPSERKACYEADIIYATNNELGFDYLRDNMARTQDTVVQGDLAYAIIDEIDSILIDEARTPLIISAPAEQSTDKYRKYTQLIPQLKNEEHYTIDEKTRSTLLTDEGVHKMEMLLGIENIYTEAGFIEVHHIEQALKAHTLFKRDKDYVVKDNEIVIVDEFTGRLMPGRRYSDGLHQAIEAKENVSIKRESRTLASITFQNFFRNYERLSGMTGTAVTEAEEFFQIYGLNTLLIPTNKPIIRNDRADKIFTTARGKFLAITKEVQERHKKGQPVLVGTASIETSELLSKLFTKSNIPHEVLNAKQHEREAEIVAEAGQKGAITIATNMAGRGTDIKLGEGVKELGGLLIIGSERHESRRIDNQLRGRGGRQGDPGESQFFVSMEDTLMRVFGGGRMQAIMKTLNVPEDMPIQNRIISKSIETAQRRIEGHNFDTRKHVLEYDDVLSKQRKAIYTRRRFILDHQNVSENILELFEQEAASIVNGNLNAENGKYDLDKISIMVKRMTQKEIILDKNTNRDRQKLTEQLVQHFELVYESKQEQAPNKEIFARIEKAVYLRAIDALWMEHIDKMANLRNDVSLYGYGQRNPLGEYKKESYYMYERLLSNIHTNTLQTLFHIQFTDSPEIQTHQNENTSTNQAAINTPLSGQPKIAQNTAASKAAATILAGNKAPRHSASLKSESASAENIGRNEKVKVRYSDGKEVEAKYKKVEADIEKGLCEIVEKI